MGTRFEVGIAASAPVTHATSEKELLLELMVHTRWGKLPLEYSGTGRTEALFLSALLAGIAGKIVLLDEPAQHLHPTVQASLIAEMQDNTANQFFLITHSPVLVSPDAIKNVSRFYMFNDSTQRAFLPLTTIGAKERATIQKELRMSSDVRALLFARGVILVEGETEYGALPIWYQKLFARYLENEDIAIHSVEGHKNFKTYVRLLENYRVPWVIVCDGAVLGSQASPDPIRKPCDIANQLTSAGVQGIDNLEPYTFTERRTRLEQHGVFTLAQSEEQGKEGFEDSVPLIKQVSKQLRDESKVRRARVIAEEHDCPLEVQILLEKVSTCLKQRMQVIT